MREVGGNTLFVLGAGVDRAFDMPLLSNLSSEIANWSNFRGKGVEQSIKSHVGKIYFSLTKEKDKRGERLGEEFLTNESLASRLIKILDEHSPVQDSKLEAVKEVLSNIGKIRDFNHVDARSAIALGELSGRSLGVEAEERIYDVRGLPFDTVVREAFVAIFSRTLETAEKLDPDSRAILERAVTSLQNIEQLLASLFAGFFIGDVLKQKRYYYTSWMLCGYLKETQKEIKAPGQPKSFYDVLDSCNTSSVITLNYTDFFKSNPKDKILHFHGSLDEYYVFHERRLVTDDKAFRDAKFGNELKNFIEKVMMPPNWNASPSECYLPAIMPPLALKPVLGLSHLRQWYSGLQLIEQASDIFVVGYSFAQSDTHFHDLLKARLSSAKVVVVNPSAADEVLYICAVLGEDANDMDVRNISGADCWISDRLVIAPIKAENLSKETLEQLLN